MKSLFSIWLITIKNGEYWQQLDFLEDLTPLLQALFQTTIQSPNVSASLPSGSFVIINSAICFKKFETRYANGLGETTLSITLHQIRGTLGFRGLCSIAWDNSNTIPQNTRKGISSLGNAQISNCGNIVLYQKWMWKSLEKSLMKVI